MTYKININEEYKKLKHFVITNRWYFVCGMFIVFLAYITELTNFASRIDTETYIVNPEVYLNSLKLGRWALVLFRVLLEKNFLSSYHLTPYFVSTMFIICLLVAMIVFTYWIDTVSKINIKYSLLSYLIFIIHPLWVHQFYFTLQILPVSVGIILSLLAGYFTFKGIEENNILYFLLAITGLTLSIGIYQLFIILYIAQVILGFLLLYTTSEQMRGKTLLETIIFILKLVGVCIISFIVNHIISGFFIEEGGYVENMMLWGTQSTEVSIQTIRSHIYNVGFGIHQSYINYGLSIIILVLSYIFNLKVFKQIKTSWIYVLSIIVMQSTPFLLTVYTARYTSMWSEFVMPFVIAGNILLACNNILKTNLVKYINIGIVSFMLLNQLNIFKQLWYTDQLRFQADMILASQVNYDINHLVDASNKPLAFVGTRSNNLNASTLTEGIIGLSTWQRDAGVEPRYWHSTRRICNGMSVVSYNYQSVSVTQMIEARKLAYNMPIWPAEGSIVDNGEFITIKLSEDEWYIEDILGWASEEVVLDEADLATDGLRYALDSVIADGENLTIVGWLLKPDSSSTNSKQAVYLIGENETRRLATSQVSRADVEKAFPSNYDYTQSGFKAMISLNDLQEPLENYRIVLGYQLNGEELLLNTERGLQ